MSKKTNPADYIKKMRLRDKELAQGWGQLVTPLRPETEGGIQRGNCANTEGIFRTIQSIPSPVISPENHLAPPGAGVAVAPVAPLPRKAGKKP